MYRQIETSFWSDPKIRKLDRDSRDLMIYFITGTNSHFAGIYYVPVCLISDELRLKTATVEQSIQVLETANLIRWDNERQIVWVRQAFKRCGKGPKILRGVALHLATLHESPLILAFLEHYQQFEIPYQYPFDGASAPELETPQDQKQKQKQKQKQNTEPPLPPKGQGRVKKLPLLKIQKEIGKAIEAQVDLQKFIAEYPDIPVAAVYEEFIETCLSGTSKKPWPNPYDYRDFHKALHTWCRKRRDGPKQTQPPKEKKNLRWVRD